MVFFKVVMLIWLGFGQVLFLPAPGQGLAHLAMLYQALQDLKRDLPRYNENIRMSEAVAGLVEITLAGWVSQVLPSGMAL